MKAQETHRREGQEPGRPLALLRAILAAMLPLIVVIASLAALVPAMATP